MAPTHNTNASKRNAPQHSAADRNPTQQQTTANRNPPQHKFDPANHFRSEIEQRTAAGETCEQIASALRAQGVDITNKTISRRRVEWGLRKRPHSKLLGKKSAVPRPKKASGTKTADTHARKAEIQVRTEQGQSAEEIAEALEAQGYVLKKGASTILRLQTQWNLIPHDPDRARGRRRKKEVEVDENGDPVPKLRKKDLPKLLKEQEREANKVQQMQAQTLHYPTNCNFGPKKRVAGATVDGFANGGMGEDSVMLDEDGAEGDDGIMPGLDGVSQLSYPSPLEQQQPQAQPPYHHHQHPPLHHHHNNNTTQTVSVAAEIMSVEFLVDLATSTLSAAENLKAMLLAYQARQPVPGSATGLPPSAEDLSVARRKVREAAAVMHDLAAEPKE